MGPYSVTITDNNGCSITNSLDIDEPELLENFIEEYFCIGDSVFFNNVWYTSSGIFLDTVEGDFCKNHPQLYLKIYHLTYTKHY